MAKGNIQNCLDVTLEFEGGWADHPKDPGGATMKGVTLTTFRRYVRGATKTDLRNISDEMLQKIYRAGYWDKLRCDELPVGVDLVAFDGGVNSGPGRAGKWLQGAVGARKDGIVGDKTLARVLTQDPATVVKAVCAKRLGFVQSLRTWSTFGRGWSRRIAKVQAKGLAMVLSAQMAAEEVRAALVVEAHEQERAARSKMKITASAGAAGAGGAGVELAGGVDMWVAMTFLGAAVAASVVAYSRARIHRRMADAYRSEAA